MITEKKDGIEFLIEKYTHEELAMACVAIMKLFCEAESMDYPLGAMPDLIDKVFTEAKKNPAWKS